jgi:hypothetical protein
MSGYTRLKDEKEEAIVGTWKRDKLEKMIAKAAQISSPGRKIAFISRQFLGTPYQEGTLIGDEKTPERFVVDLSAVDCFTFIDYVEALRLSDSFSTFRANLALVRYRSGIIAFDHRNHFFSDWITSNREFVEDVTGQVGGRHARSSNKTLNIREDGTHYLSGIDSTERIVGYIPSSVLDGAILRKCRTGDYIGVYAQAPGLDVTHVGIFVRSKGKTFLRHASSLPKYRKVIDQEFSVYMSGNSGFIVLRPQR